MSLAMTRLAAASDGVSPGGHIAYAVGGAIGEGPTFRQSLDIGFDIAFTHSSGGLYAPDKGWMIGASVITGFGTYPTYVTLEAGQIVQSFMGTNFTAGFACRVAPDLAFGLEGKAEVSFIIFSLGARLLALPIAVSGSAEIQLSLLLGFQYF